MQTLSPEQQFQIASLKLRAELMTRDDLIQMLMCVYEKMMRDDAKYRAEIAKEWGIPQRHP